MAASLLPAILYPGGFQRAETIRARWNRPTTPGEGWLAAVRLFRAATHAIRLRFISRAMQRRRDVAWYRALLPARLKQRQWTMDGVAAPDRGRRQRLTRAPGELLPFMHDEKADCPARRVNGVRDLPERSPRRSDRRDARTELNHALSQNQFTPASTS